MAQVTALSTARLERLRLCEIAIRDMTEGVVITDTEPHPDGFRILDVNDAMCRLAGRPREELIGGRTGVLHGPDTPRSKDDPEATRLFQDGQICVGRTVHYRKDGTRFIAECMASPLHDDSGRVTHYVSVQRDITAQVEAEQALAESRRVLQSVEEETIREYNRRLSVALEELARVQAQAIRQERLNALGQMASGIAHDFNNALSPILGFAELLLSDPRAQEDPEVRTRYLSSIRTAAQDASSAVRRLREFYRKREENEPFVEADLPSLVQEVVQLSLPRWQRQSQERGVRIDVALDLVETPLACVVPSEVREALTNLVFNAVDAMPEGGTITIRTRRAPVEGFVDVEVADTGVGMTEEVRRRCVEPFFTTKGADGTGMGLAMVYGIVQRHRGELGIDSTPGKGSTFRLRIPVAGVVECAAALSASEGPPGRTLRILAVDDEPLIREVLAGYLGLDGHHVEKAAHGREALDRFQRDGIDLVVTDAAMPVMGGLELAKAVKALRPGTPVILLTGFGDTMKAHGTVPEGVDLVLGKPATIEALRAAISQVTRPARACPV